MIEFTGERVIPGQVDADLLNEHLGRYSFAEALVADKRVLDAGCGVGYGSARLATVAKKVFALDNSAEAVQSGRAEYPDVSFVHGNCAGLPFADASLDAVVAFGVIEHLENWQTLLSEAARVLRPAGIFLVSTPNRVYYADSRDEPNPFHVHEFDYEEFSSELAKHFAHQTMFFENHANAITFTSETVEGVRTRLEPTPADPANAHFFLAVCSQSTLYGSPAFVYLPKGGNVLRDREEHIRKLEAELNQKTQWLKESTAELEDLTGIHTEDQRQAQIAIKMLEVENREKTTWAEDVKADLAELEAEYKRLGVEHEERKEWALEADRERERTLENYAKLEAEKATVHEHLERAVKLLDEAETRVIERTEWAQRLDAELAEYRRKIEAIQAAPAYRFARTFGLAPKLSNTPEE